MKKSNQSKIKSNLLTVFVAFGILVVSTVGLHYGIDKRGSDTSPEAAEGSERGSNYQTTPAMEDMYNASMEDKMVILLQDTRVQESISREREEERERKIAEQKERERQEQIRLAKIEEEKKRQAEEAERQRLAKIEQQKQLEQQKKQQEKQDQVARTQSNQNKVKENKVVQVSAEKPQGKTLTMEATAYTAYCNGCSGVTATGVDLRANPSAKVIAVDPNVIPLGTKVHVEGYGTAIAADTGGAIKGHKIDVHIPTKEKAYSWGRRTVKVTILN